MKKDGIIFVGLNQVNKEIIQGFFKPTMNVISIDSSDSFYETVDQDHETQPYAIFAGRAISDVPPIDIAQSFRLTFPDSKIIFIETDKESFEYKSFKKNGFHESLIMPMDQMILKRFCKDLLVEMDITEQMYREIQVCDLDGDTPLSFGTFVFMPLNRRFVRISNPGQALDQKRLELLKKKSYATIHIEASDLGKFYDFVAQRLSELTGSHSGLSETQRQEKLRTNVRGLILSMFDSTDTASFSEGNAIVDNCKNIVELYINQKTNTNAYSVFAKLANEKGDFYDHTSRVSVYATLFAMVTGACKPEDVGIAGLFHDLGKTALPLELQTKPYFEMTASEKDLYEKHPELSINLVAQRRINMDVSIKKAILQHHERIDGSGYPKKLRGALVSIEAQILALADQFDHLTSLEEGRRRLTPLEALDELIRTRQFDRSLLEGIRKTLSDQAEQIAS